MGRSIPEKWLSFLSIWLCSKFVSKNNLALPAHSFTACENSCASRSLNCNPEKRFFGCDVGAIVPNCW